MRWTIHRHILALPRESQKDFSSAEIAKIIDEKVSSVASLVVKMNRKHEIWVTDSRGPRGGKKYIINNNK